VLVQVAKCFTLTAALLFVVLLLLLSVWSTLMWEDSLLLTVMARFRLELRETSCVSVHPGPYEDSEPSGYDYENDHDTSEYCPNVALVSTVNCIKVFVSLCSSLLLHWVWWSGYYWCLLLRRSLVQVLARKYIVVSHVVVFLCLCRQCWVSIWKQIIFTYLYCFLNRLCCW
jgi:hypothetical protein